MFILAVNVLLTGEQTWAYTCKDIFSSASALSAQIHEFRESRISKKRKGEIFGVNGVSYLIEGQLGRGTSTVLLAYDPQMKPVTIKIVKPNEDDANWPNTIFYEMAATQFYLDAGETVPKILSYETFENSKGKITKALLVKEYREGITYDDLGWLSEFRVRTWGKHYPLGKELLPELRRLLKIHEGFPAWLKTNNINLWEHPFDQLSRRMESYDAAHRNFLYDSTLNKWILFDP